MDRERFMKKKGTDKIPKNDISKARLDLKTPDFASAIINNIGDPVFVKDENSTLTLVNDAFCKLFDLTRDNIIGKTLAEDISPEEMDGFLKIDAHVLKTGQENIIEESLTVRGGPTKTISTRKTRYVDSYDNKYLIGVIRDITDRKIDETQLKETLSQNELAVEMSELGVWELNVDSGELLWNDRHLEFYGITRKEFSNNLEGWRSQLHPDDKNYAESRFQEVFENKSIHDLNFRIIRPNGEIRYLNAAGTPIVIDGKLVKVIGVNRDITESKNSEKKLKESEERIRIFTQNVPDFLLQIDSTGKINYINKTLEGLTQKDVIGSSVYSWIPEEFSEEFKGKVEKVFRSGGSEIIEYLVNGLKGEPIWFESKVGPLKKSGKITQVIIVSRDITERKQAEEHLKKTFSRLNLVVKTAKLGVWSFDVNTGEVIWDDRQYEIHGIDPSEFDLTLESYNRFVHPEDLEYLNVQQAEVYKNKSVYNINFRIILPNKEVRYISASATPVIINGELDRIIGVNEDITERKTAELILKRTLNENLELKQQIEAENIYLKEELKLEGSFNDIVGSSKSLKKVLKQVEQVAKTDSTVLILGETGTGKELFAKAIHNASDRKGKSMVKVNCSALPADLIESELFGHEQGAFTGALNRKIGRFELANGGTIFLDEIGDLPIGLQTRLLRVLQESEFERVGGEKTIKVDVRIITATNRNLEKQVLENKFRQDLYYRLNVFPITCPPLRDRINDIQSLVHHFVNKYNPKVNNKIKSVHQKTIARLMHYNWPGNVRELENVIERAVIVNQGGQLRLGKWFMDSSFDIVAPDDHLKTLETVERDYIIKVLEKTNWKIRGKNGAAEILGMQPTTLESRMKKRSIKR